MTETQSIFLEGDAASYDYFGASVSIDGNYTVIGAYNENGEGSNRGIAYVYERVDSTWTKIAKLSASDAADDDAFGNSVSIDGDYIIVGAVGEDGAGTDYGAAYIFKKPTGGWEDMTETAKLTASDSIDTDNFGKSVAISGDWAIVGAYKSDDSGTDSGSAYIFKKPTGGWTNMTETKEITGSDTEAGDHFGDSISIDGNYALVGAPTEDGTGTERGAAYVFYKDEGGTDNWGQQAKLTTGDIQDNSMFAIHKLSISGNYAAVGRVGDDDNGSGAGAVYIYHKDEGGTDNWGQQAKLKASDGAANDNLGYSVSIYGDTVIAGAKGDNSETGSAYIFEKPGTGWQNMTETQKISAGDGASGDQFGYDTSISGNYSIIGAPVEDDEGRTDSGAAYIFGSSSSSNVPEFKDYIYIITILAAISMMYKNLPQYSHKKT